MRVVLAELVTYPTGCQIESRYTTKSRQRRMKRVKKTALSSFSEAITFKSHGYTPQPLFFSKPNWPGPSPLHPTWTSCSQWWDGTNTLHLQEMVSSSSAITLSLSSTATLELAITTGWRSSPCPLHDQDFPASSKFCDCIWKRKKQSKVDRLN